MAKEGHLEEGCVQGGGRELARIKRIEEAQAYKKVIQSELERDFYPVRHGSSLTCL